MVAVVLLAGGTGGHIVPALVVAEELGHRQAEVHWIGRPDSEEEKQVRAGNDAVHYHGLRAGGLRGKSPWVAVRNLCILLASCWRAFWLLRLLRPEVAVGFGGYVSLPGACACLLLRIPLVLHEQNARTGSVNRLLARRAECLIAGMSGAFSECASQRKVELLGNPVRSEMEGLKRRTRTGDGMLRLLIFGGSQGAEAINQMAPEFASLLGADWTIHHLCGRGSGRVSDLQQRYRALGICAQVEEYRQEMASLYRWADLAFCRAGAMTIAELAAASLPALLLPLPSSVDNHQQINAALWSERGAGISINQNEISLPGLVEWLQGLKGRLGELSRGASTLAYPQAGQKVAERVLNIVGEAA